MLWWENDRISLSLNGKDIETKEKDSPLFEWSGQAFLSKTDEAIRALELAIAFDLSCNALMGSAISGWPSVQDLPALLVPLVVCEAFALELYLKSLHQMDHGQRARRGHKLDALFFALKPTTQQ